MSNDNDNKLSMKENFVKHLFSDDTKELFDRFGFESTKLNENKDIPKPTLSSRQKIKRINSIDEFEKRNNEIPI